MNGEILLKPALFWHGSYNAGKGEEETPHPSRQAKSSPQKQLSEWFEVHP